MASRDEVVSYLDEELGIAGVEEESLNGLQVQGADEITGVALATDAALATYRRAADLGCEMILAHHGILWARPFPITGAMYEQLRFLLARDLNLYAAHLPLDMHPTLGNNAQLVRMVGIEDPEPFGRYHGKDIGFSGVLPEPRTVHELASSWRDAVGGSPVVLPFGPEKVRTCGVVSGGGASMLGDAVSRKLDCFVTGEGAHWNHHLALEAGINVIYLGHYHSETPGVRAVGEALAGRFGLRTHFIDEPTLV